MAGFGDIAPAVEVVNIRGTEIKMGGVSYEDIVGIGQRFKEAAAALGSGMTVFDFAAQFPDAIGALLATGFGQKGNKKVEEQARGLSVGDQAVLLEALIKASFAEGFGPFVRILQALGFDAKAIQQHLTGLLSPSSSDTASTSVRHAA